MKLMQVGKSLPSVQGMLRKEQEAKEEKACMFVYVCVNTRDISSTHTWYGSGKIFDGTKRICQSQRATCHYQL